MKITFGLVGKVRACGNAIAATVAPMNSRRFIFVIKIPRAVY
jgi:hypothetical protein